MNWNPWVPMLSGLAIMAIPLLLVLYLPETLNYNAPATDSGIASSSSSTISAKAEPLFREMFHTIRSSLSFLGSDARILFILPAFFLHMLILNRDTLLQYISTRFAISIASATVLISVRSGLILFSLLLFLQLCHICYATACICHRKSLTWSLLRAVPLSWAWASS